jgi:hypothetical protein
VGKVGKRGRVRGEVWIGVSYESTPHKSVDYRAFH